MQNSNNEETTNSDPTEPIISWSGVQGETQEEELELPAEAEELEQNNDAASTEETAS